MLKLRNVDVFYGKIHAVRRVSLHVDKGEIVALIGANGAGKTTLLGAISGIIRSGGGGIAFEGTEIAGKKPDKIVRCGISQVPERRLVFAPLSVADNLLLGSYTRRSSKERAEAAEDLEAVYSMFPVLSERSKQAAGTLSGGEQQMLAIGRALMARPKCLLLDEPGMGLAPTICKEIFKRVVELREKRGLTVLLVEQNARAALSIADRGYVLETGRIMAQGPADELLANKDVQRAYIGLGAPSCGRRVYEPREESYPPILGMRRESAEVRQGLRMQIEMGTKLALELSGLEGRVGSLLVGMAPESYLILYTPLTQEARKRVNRKNVVTGRYVHQGTVFGFKAQVLDYIMYPAALLFLSYPSEVEVLELRREPRAPCYFPGLMRINSISAGCMVRDMSPSGCRVDVDAACRDSADGLFAPGLRVQLDFYAFEEKNAYSLYTEVVNACCRDGVLSVGLKFDDVHKHFKKIAAGYVQAVSAGAA